MKKKLINILFVVVLCILVIMPFACHQDPKPIYINSYLKDYFNYQVGSYWVFYDSLNNKRDCLYVSSNIVYPPFYTSTTSVETMDVGMGFIADNISFILECSTSNAVISVKNNQNGNHSSEGLVYGMPFYLSGPYGNLLVHNNKYYINNINYIDVYIAYTQQFDSSSGFFQKDTLCFNYENGVIAILLNNFYFKNRLYLVKSKIIR